MSQAIHPLHRWMFERRASQARFAATIGASQNTISDWITGKKVPGWRLMARVWQATEGAVSPNDFVAFKAPPAPRPGGE